MMFTSSIVGRHAPLLLVHDGSDREGD